MPRPPLDNICGATYHVMNRGNRKALIYEDDRDRLRFLAILIRVSAEYCVEVLAVCLMGNHFHLVVVTPAGNLSEFMQQLEGRFAAYSNWRHKRVGHVFQGPFRRVMIEHDIHLFTAACYVFMNPVVSGFAARLEGWKWSSYAAAAGLAPAPRYLSLNWVEALFPADTFEESQRQFRLLMDTSQPVQAYLQLCETDSARRSFRSVVRSYIGERYHEVSLPRMYRTAFRPDLAELVTTNMDRRQLALAGERAHMIHGYKYSEIAKAVGLHPDTVARLCRTARRSGSGSDPEPDPRPVKLDLDLDPDLTPKTNGGSGSGSDAKDDRST